MVKRGRTLRLGKQVSGVTVSAKLIRPVEVPTANLSEAVGARENNFIELKRRVAAAGLFRKHRPYYAGVILSRTLGLFALSIWFTVSINVWWLHLLNAALWAVVTAQTGLVIHDVGHRAVFRSSRWNDALGHLMALLGFGMPFTWWPAKHNKHHAFPNQLDVDPDIGFQFLAFDNRQLASKKTWLERFMVRYQAFFFIGLLCLQGINMRRNSTWDMLRGRTKSPRIEAPLILLHYAGYFWLIFTFMSVPVGIAFIVVHQALFGLFLSSMFAPNHKGMEILPADTEMDFLTKQVITARNVKPNWVSNFWFGGLHYQIEHHLFPSIARIRLKKLKKIVEPFCEEVGVPYVEVGCFRSWWQVLAHLHQVSRPLRRRGRRAAGAALEQ